MSGAVSPLASHVSLRDSSAGDRDDEQIVRNPPHIRGEHEGFASESGPRVEVLDAKPVAAAENPTFQQRLTAVIAAVADGQVRQVLALAVRPECSVTINVGGRPAALNAVDQQKVCLMLKMGFSRPLAAAELGVHRTTLNRTIARDPAFRERVLEAEQLAERAPLLCVIEAAQTKWQAAVWLLKNNQAESVKRRRKRAKERAANRDTKRWIQDTNAMFGDRKAAQADPPPVTHKSRGRKTSK